MRRDRDHNKILYIVMENLTNEVTNEEMWKDRGEKLQERHGAGHLKVGR